MRVLIADDDAYVRRGLKEIILEEYEDAEIGEARTAREAISIVRKQQRERFWDVMVLDISMPGGSGIEVLRALKGEFSKLPILVLSGHSEDQYAVRTLKAGAAGFLTKETAPEELLSAIKKVLGGGKYVSPSLAEKLVFKLTDCAESAPHEHLSDRELEILRMIASGREVSEIAAELNLSVKTISTYRTRLLNKMNMATNAQLMLYAIKNGLVRDEEIDDRGARL
ncbi:MAG: two-component system, NarL family, invasion response regulator UvrY [Acidobacteriota bacterium]|jgi:two-component system invasion response regulator UvrY|nr:two-component system, NarL family, invasion response regulator UvrY [Acidobacteriota bacterium]